MGEKPNVKRTKMVNGNSTRNSVHVSNVVMTAQKSRCQKCQRSPKMKKNQKTKKKSQKTKKWKIQKKPFPEMMENGQNANRNQLKMVKSHARALSVLFSVWRVSKSKEMPRLNAKKIKKESGNSTSHSVL